VIGQGYVGLSLACAAAEASFPVTGLDVDESRISDLLEGSLTVPGVRQTDFRSALATGRITFTTESAAVRDSDIIVICVPTPVRDGAPDLSYVESASREVARHLKPGVLVVLESTTYPGTTDTLVRSILESSGYAAGRDFLLAYSPERIDPGSEEWGLQNTPRIVGGTTPEATGVAAHFYGQLADKVVVVSSSRAAELAKLLENSFRHVNIALVNEMAMVCQDLGIDVWEVIDATATKPFGFMPFYPGPGVGGNCIPVDPAYLAWHVRRDAGRQFRTLEQAEDINAQMPAYVAGRIGDALNAAGKPVKGARILVLGVTYKADVGEIGESPAVKLMTRLDRRGARIAFHDPFVASVTFNDQVVDRTDLTNAAVSQADCVALIAPHRSYDLDWIAEHAALVFDARNAFGPDRRPNVIRL
jgi:UDP-N-acetyl-D-glucosamine dehydrogenase